MTSTLSNQTAFAYLFVALVGLLILRRAYRLTQGAPIGTSRLLVLPAFYVIIYAAELTALGFGGGGSSVTFPLYLSFTLDAILVVVGTFVAYGYTLRHLQIYRAEGEAGWSYRMSPLLPVIYVVLFFARVAIESVVLNESPLVFAAPSALSGISAFALVSLFAVDALWGLSTGFLIGRSVGVYHEWQQKLHEPSPPAPAPLP